MRVDCLLMCAEPDLCPSQVGGERDHGFDRARYERLLSDIKRYQRYLKHPSNAVVKAE